MKLMNKRIISLILALVMICGMMPMQVFAAEETEVTEENLWNGRSAVFVGDSITAGTGTTKTYYQFLEETLGFGSVTAMGVAGSCVSASSDYGQSNQPLINRYQSIPSADLIMVFMGTNDYGHETPLGSVEDTQDGTFYGALNTIIPALVAKHTSSKIVFVTPLHRYGFGTSKILGTQFTYDHIPNGVGATLGDYVDALKTVCANNGVSVIDLHTEYTLDPADADVRTNYMPDGLHPNAAGHEVIAGIMESHIRGYEPVEGEPVVQTELIHGNKFAAGNNQSCRVSSRINYYLKAGTVITLNHPDVMQWACARTSNEFSSNNLGYFPDSGWSDKETAVVAADGWVGFTFKYRDETQSFDLTKPLSDYITIEEPHTHTYENGICTGCGATVSPYLQQLPEKIIGCTNLYDSLAPVKGYYTATKYDTSNGNVLSVVIPVEPGDRIAASSFGPVSENMGSVNGIRVTYLLGNEIVSSLSPGDVYSGYTANGYITVPDGVDAVCVPWWKPSDSNWLTLSQSSKDFAVHIPKTVSAQAPTCTESGYTAGEICEICNVSLGEREEIPATGHSYSGDTCTVCGTVNLLAFLDGKYVSILGDSISTFNGYSNNAAANTTIGGNGPRYDAGTADTKPGSYCLLESVDDTWWMHFANRSGMKLLVNNSWAGSQVFGGQTSDGRVIPAAYLDRCVNLHDNTLENNPDNTPINPDVIFVYLGINDYNFNRSKVGTGAVDYAGLVNSDGTYVTPETFGEAYGIMLHKMCNAYPDAQIFAMTLLPENLYSVDKTAWEQHNTYIRGAAEYYGIPVVDLAENCAITWENYSGYMIDKIHPTTAGMKLISDCIEAELVAYYKENQTHTHTYKAAVTPPTCTEPGYTTYTCECSDSYVDDYVDATGHSYENGICTGCGESAPTLAGKTISILGASMSTYTGISNNPDYNSTIGNNTVYYTEGKLGVYKNDTWWMQAANDLDLRLLVNNSWSGSSLLYERNGTVGAYVDRCVQLHNNEGETPDIIAIQMGTNDFQYYKDTLGTADIDYDALITENEDGSYTYAEPTTSLEAAAIVLHKISIRYPDAEVYYLNISQRIDGTDELIRSFNAELKQVVEHFGAHIVDIYGSAITMADFDTYIGDGRVHPNCLGMDAYTEAFKRALLANTAYEVDTHTVSFDLDGVTADYGDDKIVVSGDAFSCTLTAEDGKELSVSVTMGGEGITGTTYENGTVSIESVTDDVVITAEATAHKFQNYRWEFDGTDLACVSGDNTLSKNSGTTTDGVFSKTSYTLENEVVLMHDLPWIVEWKCEGTFLNTNGSSGARIFTSDNVNANYNARYIFKSNTNGIIAMGEKDTNGSHNYGIALADHGIDWTELHTYRLENRIATDGSNMIYLLVDGKEIGPMNHYFIGTKNQNTTSNWLSGKDFVFPYMGTDTHGFTNASIDYIQVFESHTHSYSASVTFPTCTEQGYTTYTCECGDFYRTPWLDETAYEGMTIACVGDSLTAAVGVTKDENDYVTLLAEQLGMDYIRLGVSGTTLCTDGSRTCNITRLTEAYLDGADIVTIAMGINDFCAAGAGYYELGDINSTDSSTIYGAARMWCERIAELRKTDSLKDTQFYFVTPVICSWNNSVTSARDWDQSKTNIHGYTLRDLCNAIIEVVELYDVAVIDLNLLSGMYYVDAEDNNTAVFGGDGVHPGATGHAMMANAIANALLQNDLRDDHTHTFGSWISTTWPSCFAGEQQRICTICSATESRTREQHNYCASVTAPTCTEQGYTTYTCECGKSYEGDYVNATGHSYENGICTGCGAGDPNWNPNIGVVFINEKTTIPHTVNGRTVTVDYELPCSVGYWDEAQQRYVVIPAVEDEDGGYSFTDPSGVEEVLLVITGDTNNDGRVTASDIARLNAHLKNKTVLTVKELFAADVNHDGRLDDADKSAMSTAILGVAFLEW